MKLRERTETVAKSDSYHNESSDSNESHSESYSSDEKEIEAPPAKKRKITPKIKYPNSPKLPTEIWIQIVSYLTDHVAIISLTLVNNQLRQILAEMGIKYWSAAINDYTRSADRNVYYYNERRSSDLSNLQL